MISFHENIKMNPAGYVHKKLVMAFFNIILYFVINELVLFKHNDFYHIFMP